jgi:hypothetical protein
LLHKRYEKLGHLQGHFQIKNKSEVKKERDSNHAERSPDGDFFGAASK